MRKSYNKISMQLILFLITAFFLIIVVSLVACNVSVKEIFTVIYYSGDGGSVVGTSEQKIEKGYATDEVQAVANDGYSFVKWSDGKKNATRNDVNITSGFSVQAQFKRISWEYTYNYNNATAHFDATDITLKPGELQGAIFAVPEKEYFNFGGWYLDEGYEVRVADEYGNPTIGDELFDNEPSELYAKWTAIEKIEYKVLMVFVTEVKADLETADGTIVNVDYKMSSMERKVCNAIMLQFEKHLNETLDGLVTFDVDSYFTAVPAGIENIEMTNAGTDSGEDFYNYNICAQDLPEVSEIVEDYRAVMTTFSLDDHERLLFNYAGSAGEKFAMNHFESLVGQCLMNGKPLSALLDLENDEWNGIMGDYVHEFAHTIEQGITSYQFHKALAQGQSQGDDTETMRLYLLNQLTVSNEKEKVGIPFAYWKNEIFNVKYESNDGGYIGADWANGWNGSDYQRVPNGTNSNTITAYAVPGYKFIGWSDGLDIVTRRDYNIQADFTVTALFELDVFEVKYNAGDGGVVLGESLQNVIFYEQATEVIAKPNDGYRFVGWSDGYMRSNRADFVGLDPLTGQVKVINVTAKFEKIE